MASTFLALTSLDAGPQPDHFVGPPAPERGGRTYGGQLLAQAIVAAYRTVDGDRRLHSLHAYFLRSGDVERSTAWEVERIRDGRSFAVRSVIGRQPSGEVFRILMSFHTPEPGLDHQPALDYDIATLARPEDVSTDYVDFCRQHPDMAAETWFGHDRPMDIRYINPPDPIGGPAIDEPQLTWTRISEALSDDPSVHDAGLAYLADSSLIDHVLLPHGHRWHDRRLTGASLDHTMWFHRPARADDWLLYDQRVESTGGARGLATGRIYTLDGGLAVTCGQEGLIRWTEPPA